MKLRRALSIAVCMVPFAAGHALAQFQPVPTPQQEPPCVQNFIKLRDDAQKKAAAIKVAGERKADAKEACGLFNAFSAAEVKMIKYATENGTWCGIPPEVVTNLKAGHARTSVMQTRVCKIAAAPIQSSAPSLSDALGGGIVPDANNIKSGRGGGTYDTLSGTPLGK
jgi:hypothetical protein